MSGQHTFTVKTWAESRSNRRDRTYVVVAAHANDACYEATLLAERAIRQFVSVYTEVVDVDGAGAPADCPHAEARKWAGFRTRWDGGRDCAACQQSLDSHAAAAERA